MTQRFMERLLKSHIPLSKREYNFCASYKHLELMGFTEKAYEWSFIDRTYEELKTIPCSLAERYAQKSTP